MRRLLSAATVITTLVVPPTAHGWAWPVDGPVLRPFALAAIRTPQASTAASTSAQLEGALMRAPASGTVSFAGGVPNGGRGDHDPHAPRLAVTLLQLPARRSWRRTPVAEAGGPSAPSARARDAVTTEPHVHLGVRVPTTERLPRPARAPAVTAGAARAAGARARQPAAPATELRSPRLPQPALRCRWRRGPSPGARSARRPRRRPAALERPCGQAPAPAPRPVASDSGSRRREPRARRELQGRAHRGIRHRGGAAAAPAAVLRGGADACRNVARTLGPHARRADARRRRLILAPDPPRAGRRLVARGAARRLAGSAAAATVASASRSRPDAGSSGRGGARTWSLSLRNGGPRTAAAGCLAFEARGSGSRREPGAGRRGRKRSSPCGGLRLRRVCDRRRRGHASGDAEVGPEPARIMLAR